MGDITIKMNKKGKDIVLKPTVHQSNTLEKLLQNVFLNITQQKEPGCYTCNLMTDPATLGWSSSVLYSVEKSLREGLNPAVADTDGCLRSQLIITHATVLMVSLSGSIGLCANCFADDNIKEPFEKGVNQIFACVQEEKPYYTVNIKNMQKMQNRLTGKGSGLYTAQEIAGKAEEQKYQTDMLHWTSYLTNSQLQAEVSRQVYTATTVKYDAKGKGSITLTKGDHQVILNLGRLLRKKHLTLEGLLKRNTWKSGILQLSKLANKVQEVRTLSILLTRELTKGISKRGISKSLNSLVRAIIQNEADSQEQAHVSVCVESRLTKLMKTFNGQNCGQVDEREDRKGAKRRSPQEIEGGMIKLMKRMTALENNQEQVQVLLQQIQQLLMAEGHTLNIEEMKMEGEMQDAVPTLETMETVQAVQVNDPFLEIQNLQEIEEPQILELIPEEDETAAAVEYILQQ